MSKVIEINNLSKVYDLGLVGTGTLSKDLNRTWAKLRGDSCCAPLQNASGGDHWWCFGAVLLCFVLLKLMTELIAQIQLNGTTPKQI